MDQQILDMEPFIMKRDKKTRHEFTVRDIERLPEGMRAELIDGQIYLMASPARTHQRILVFLLRKIADYIDEKGGDCEVNPAPFAVYLFDDDRNYVEPDLSIICDKSKLDDNGCHGAPDWIIEIVSPGSIKMDYAIKMAKYQEAGVLEYWIVNPKSKSIIVNNFKEDEEKEYLFDECVPAGIYDDFSIDFRDIKM